MANVPGSLLQAIHDYQFGRGVAQVNVAVLVVDEQPFSPQQLMGFALNIMNRPPTEKPLPPTPPQIHWARQIIQQARRAEFGGNPMPPLPAEVITLHSQVLQAFRLGPGSRTPTQLELQEGLTLIAQGKMLELCEKIVRRKDQFQQAQQQVLMMASRLRIPVWLIEANPQLNAAVPPPTRNTHVGLRARGEFTRIAKARFNGFEGTNLHGQLQAVAIGRVVVMGRQTNCCVKETAIGGAAHGATGLGYTVMTSLQVITAENPTWLNNPNVEFYATL